MTVLYRHSLGNSQGNEPTCNSLGNTRPQSSQLAEPLRTDPGVKMEWVHASWFPNRNKQKSAGGKWLVELYHKVLASEEKTNKKTSIYKTGFRDQVCFSTCACIYLISQTGKQGVLTWKCWLLFMYFFLLQYLQSSPKMQTEQAGV